MNRISKLLGTVAIAFCCACSSPASNEPAPGPEERSTAGAVSRCGACATTCADPTLTACPACEGPLEPTGD